MLNDRNSQHFQNNCPTRQLIGDLSSTKYLAISSIVLSNKFKICTIVTHEDLKLNFSG